MSDYNEGSPTGKKLKQFMKDSKNARDRVAKKMGESLPHKFSINSTPKDALKKAEVGEKQHTGNSSHEKYKKSLSREAQISLREKNTKKGGYDIYGRDLKSIPHKFSKNATPKDALKKAEVGEKQHTGKMVVTKHPKVQMKTSDGRIANIIV